MPLRREIIGIYLESDRLEYVCLKRGPLTWLPGRPAPGMEPAGTVEGPVLSSLKSFLGGVRPGRNRHIYLTLSRKHFFARDVQLPSMPLEDALLSVQNSLGVVCHLSPAEIYYDIHLCRARQGINALIFYAPRKEMTPYLEIFQDEGHPNSLKGVFPVSYGIGAWLEYQGYALPAGVILPHEGGEELAVYTHKGCLFSSTWSPLQGNEGETATVVRATSKFDDLEGRIFHLGGDREPRLPPPARDRFKLLPGITENLGIAGAMPLVAGWQEISLTDRPTKLKIAHPERVIVPLLGVLILCMAAWTWNMEQAITEKEAGLSVLKGELKELQDRITPMERDREMVRKSGKLFRDVDEFMKQRPRLFTLINEIARRVPEGTWFSLLTYENGVITLGGQSKDALKTLDALRSSSMFEDVKLKGSVSRGAAGEERFSVAMKLKGYEADK